MSKLRTQPETVWPEVLTVKELADYLRVHPTTIYRLLRAGELPGFRVGSDWRFNRETVDALMRKASGIELTTRLHVQVNGRAKRLNKSVGRGHDRINEL